MSAIIKLSQVLKTLADNRETFTANGNTVRECITDFVSRYPSARNWIFDEQDNLILLILLNGQILNAKDLDLQVADNDEIYFLTAIGGG